MAKDEKGRWVGILAGPAIVFFALSALWKNETRFDFHRAASKTDVVESASDATSGQLVSLTGSMDRQLTMKGEYIDSFIGYLMVNRKAEIYAWDKDEDSDNNVTWDRRWMSSLESNSRNRGLIQRLSSKRFLPDEYQVGELTIDSNKIEFVDSSEQLQQAEMPLVRKDLVVEGEYLYLRKGDSKQLGDERVSYSAIPVPETATWFGKFDSGRGVADTSQQRDGWINAMIMDSGILHHLVAGDRTVALETMKSFLNRLKWIVRGIGTAAVVGGLLVLFSMFAGILYHIPVIGRVAQWGAILLAFIIGVPLAFITIIASYLFAHPLIVVSIIAFVTIVAFLLYQRGKSSQKAVRADLERTYGYAPDTNQLKELEFLELAQLALSDSIVGDDEQQFLQQWSRKHRWDDAKYESMLTKARAMISSSESSVSTDEHLLNLVRLAMADGYVSQYEITAIRKTARKLGYDENTVKDLINRVRDSASTSFDQSV